MESQKTVVILGAGLVGRPMALDLAKNQEFAVTVADISQNALNSLGHHNEINKIQLDLGNPSVILELVKSYDYMINALPGSIGFNALKSMIRVGKPIVDIAFYPENPNDLNELAIRSNSCVICDMGVAPGMSHLLSGYSASQLSKIHKLLIYVGGLPRKRQLPWEYKAVFSPADVIEEYTRPARLVENGEIVWKEALSEAELIDFETIGTLEAFNSDGLRTLTENIRADLMAEKTLRYPGHIDKIKLLKQMGFFETKPKLLNGKEIIPLDFTKKILFEDWEFLPGEEDLTVMRIIVEGLDTDNKTTRHQWNLLDHYDTVSGIHSMARTTGYAATAALRLIHSGLFTQAGVHLPESIGKNETNVRFILNRLEERNIFYEHKISTFGS